MAKGILLVTPLGSWQIPSQFVEKSRLLSDIIFFSNEPSESQLKIQLTETPCNFEMIPMLIETAQNGLDSNLDLKSKFNILQLCDYFDIPVLQLEVAKSISKDLNVMSIENLKDTFDTVFSPNQVSPNQVSPNQVSPNQVSPN